MIDQLFATTTMNEQFHPIICNKSSNESQTTLMWICASLMSDTREPTWSIHYITPTVISNTITKTVWQIKTTDLMIMYKHKSYGIEIIRFVKSWNDGLVENIISLHMLPSDVILQYSDLIHNGQNWIRQLFCRVIPHIRQMTRDHWSFIMPQDPHRNCWGRCCTRIAGHIGMGWTSMPSYCLCLK